MKMAVVVASIFLISACASSEKTALPDAATGAATDLAGKRQPTSVAAKKGTFCEVESKTGSGMIQCDRFYGSRPFIHLPKLQTNGRVINLIGAIDGRAGGMISTADQKAFKLVTSTGDRLLESDDYKAMLGNREQFTLYTVSGQLSADGSTITIKSFKPSLVISACAIDGANAGTWSGMISKRVAGADAGVGKFNDADHVPLHITINRMEKFKSIIDTFNSNLAEDKFVPIEEGKTAKLVGVIDNLNAEFKAADGTIFPPLNQLNDENPFKGATNNVVALERFSGMHMFVDYQFVIQFPTGSLSIGTSGMTIGGNTIITPASYISAKEVDQITSTRMIPHTTPSGFEITKFHLESPGSYAIQCPNL